MKDALNNSPSTFFSCLDAERKMELRFARWIRNSEKSDISVEVSSSSCIQSKIKDPIIPSQKFRIAFGFWKYGRIEMSVQVVRTTLPMSVIHIWIWMCINQRDMIEQICGRRQVRTAQKKCHLLPWIKSLVFWQEQMRRLSGPIKSPEPKATQTTLPQEK